jgi:hypothetical protein
MIVYSILQLNNYSFRKWEYTMSSILALFFLMFTIYYPCLLYKIFSKGSIKDKDFENKYGEMYRLYKDEKSVKFECVILFRKAIFAIVLVLL